MLSRNHLHFCSDILSSGKRWPIIFVVQFLMALLMLPGNVML